MATTKSSTKKKPVKQAVTAATNVAVKPVKPVPTKKAPTQAKPAVKSVAEAALKPVPNVAAAKPAARPRAKKAAGISPEQRRNYVEVAAFYIAERRGFALGNLLDDWVQAEAEIDRLLAGGHLGG